MASDRCKAKFSNPDQFQGNPDMKVVERYSAGEVRTRTISTPPPGSVTVDAGETIPRERGTTRIAGRVVWS